MSNCYQICCYKVKHVWVVNLKVKLYRKQICPVKYWFNWLRRAKSMAMQGCRCAVLMTLFLIKVIFCVSSRKFIYQLYGCLKANILDYGRGRSFAFQMSVTLFLVRPKSLWEPLNQIESLSPAKFVCGIPTKSILCLSVTQTVPTKQYLRQPIMIGSRPSNIHAC